MFLSLALCALAVWPHRDPVTNFAYRILSIWATPRQEIASRHVSISMRGGSGIWANVLAQISALHKDTEGVSRHGMLVGALRCKWSNCRATKNCLLWNRASLNIPDTQDETRNVVSYVLDPLDIEIDFLRRAVFVCLFDLTLSDEIEMHSWPIPSSDNKVKKQTRSNFNSPTSIHR